MTVTDTDMDKVLSAVTYKDWNLHCERDLMRAGAPFLQWEFSGPCAKTGIATPQFSRKWYLSQWMTESELVQTAFKAALTAEEHECREFFKYEGKRVFNPHVAVSALLTVCEQEEVRS